MIRRPLLAALVLALLGPLTVGCEATKPLPSPEAALASAGDPHWQPRPGLRWQIQLTGGFVDTVIANVYDLDPYRTSADLITDLRARGRDTMCHLDVGASDPGLPDAHRVPAGTLGPDGGAGRRWLDIRQWQALEPVLAARMDLCRAKGFDAVDADPASGFPGLTTADRMRFARQVAALAHRIGLRVGVRSGPALAARIEPYADFGITEGCFATARCADFSAFIDAGKAVFDVETSSADVCPLARAYGYAVTRSPGSMNGRTQPCG